MLTGVNVFEFGHFIPFISFQVKMPKVKQLDSSKAQLYACEFPNEFSKTPNNELYCKICSTTVNYENRLKVESHKASSNHKRLLSEIPGGSKQPTIEMFMPDLKNGFKSALVEAFLAADIPLFKINNSKIRQLFTYLGQVVPSETSCRVLMSELAANKVQLLKERLNGKLIFLIVGESEINGTKYLNILIGETAVPEKTYILNCSVVECVNQQVVSGKIADALNKLDVERKNVVLLLTDTARYMTAMTPALKMLYPRLFHVTCLAHLLHNCAEKIRSKFEDVDELIAIVKAATVKNKNRRYKFNEIGSPPQPVLTRWGIWLNAAQYYAINFLEVRKIVNSFEGAGVIVRRAKAAVNNSKVAESLIKIQRDYVMLPKLIQKMESSKYTIWEAHTDILTLDLKQDCVDIGSYIKKRMLQNSDLANIIGVKQENVSPAVYAELHCCQPTSTAVERSFSMLEKLLRKDPQFLQENVEKYLSLYYNKL